MRIIDKNKDFYDYCQNIYPDDLNTFDRRDSYNLSKEEFAGRFSIYDRYGIFYKRTHSPRDYQRPIILQICNTFWMFLLTITKTDSYERCKDYNIVLLNQWKDYDAKREKLKLSVPLFKYTTVGFSDTLDDPKVIERMKQDIHLNNLRGETVFNHFTVYKSSSRLNMDKEVKTIPILKNIGIAALVNPEDIYFALDEYFSKEKTENEKTESVGITDVEKVVNHGFDEKASFRGKL